MMRTLYSIKTLLLVAGISSLLPACSGDDERKALSNPNVLLIAIDSLRADHVGGEPSATANLDRLAAEGARLDNAISQSGRSLPALVTLLTSLPPEQHGVVADEFALSTEASTLAEVMNERGFATAAFVAGDRFTRERGLAQGFETYSWKPLGAAPDRAEEISDWFEDWKNAGSVRPFFALVHVPLPGRLDTGEDYAAAVEDADARTGRILETLDDLEVQNDTLVVVTSDRGHDIATGETLREAGVRIPMIFRLPSRLEAGGVFDDVARTMDIGPTIMMLARVRRPEGYGFDDPAYGLAMRDLTEVLIGVPPDKPVMVVSDIASHSQSLRLGSYKLIRWLGDEGEDRFEFFDLDRDPVEATNLFEAEAQRAGFYVQKLEAWRQRCADRPRYAIPYRAGGSESTD